MQFVESHVKAFYNSIWLAEHLLCVTCPPLANLDDPIQESDIESYKLDRNQDS
ncbi:MAG TPA: hypothetical protein VFJ51_12380 [Nitrososphaeraceae archaeon]|jgi:hypothetical protein|nr:hypothetical protein [Nitrososphaeraceae archaeon]